MFLLFCWTYQQNTRLSFAQQSGLRIRYQGLRSRSRGCSHDLAGAAIGNRCRRITSSRDQRQSVIIVRRTCFFYISLAYDNLQSKLKLTHHSRCDACRAIVFWQDGSGRSSRPEQRWRRRHPGRCSQPGPRLLWFGHWRGSYGWVCCWL